jgi:hypothetical protein
MQRIPWRLAPALAVLALASGAQVGALPTFHQGLTRAQILRTERATHASSSY